MQSLSLPGLAFSNIWDTVWGCVWQLYHIFTLTAHMHICMQSKKATWIGYFCFNPANIKTHSLSPLHSTSYMSTALFYCPQLWGTKDIHSTDLHFAKVIRGVSSFCLYSHLSSIDKCTVCSISMQDVHSYMYLIQIDLTVPVLFVCVCVCMCAYSGCG